MLKSQVKIPQLNRNDTEDDCIVNKFINIRKVKTKTEYNKYDNHNKKYIDKGQKNMRKERMAPGNPPANKQQKKQKNGCLLDNRSYSRGLRKNVSTSLNHSVTQLFP